MGARPGVSQSDGVSCHTGDMEHEAKPTAATNVESFQLDHRLVKAPFVRIAHREVLPGGDEIIKYDVRFKQPNVAHLEMPTVHSLEHAVAEHMRNHTDKLIDLAETLPFFADYRLLLFDEKLNGRKKLSEDFIAYLKRSPATTVILFLEEKVDKRSAFYKTVKERGLILPCTVQDPAFLERFALQIFKKEKKQITRSALRVLLERSGSSMYRIEAECNKILSYLGEEEEIREETVELLVKKLPEDKIFDLIEAMGNGNREKLFRYYADLLQLEESPSKIRNMMKNNLTKLLLVRERLTEGQSERDIAAALSMEPWRVSRFTREARGYTVQALENLLHSWLRLEEEIRQGKLEERTALELLLSGEEKRYFSGMRVL